MEGSLVCLKSYFIKIFVEKVILSPLHGGRGGGGEALGRWGRAWAAGTADTA